MRMLFLLLSIIVGFGACTPENNNPKGKLEIIFKAKYNNQPLVLFQNIPTGKLNPDTIYFKKLEFFISDIKGVSGGIAKDFTEVGYISMAGSLNTTAAESGTMFTINDVPAGTYSQLNLGVGLSDAVNSTSPGDYTSSSPLGSNGNYWVSWNSYILSKMEGDILQSNNSKTGFLYHAGVNGMHQLREFAKNFTIADGQTTQLVFHINAEDFFFKTGSEIDLIATNQTHSGEVGSAEYNLAKQSIQNLANALELQP